MPGNPLQHMGHGSTEMFDFNGTNDPSFTANGLGPGAVPVPASMPALDLNFQFTGPGTDDGYLSSGDQVATDLVNGHNLTGSSLSGPPAYASSEGNTSTPPNGMASMLERNFHLQDRKDVPEPKRRKILTGSPNDKKPVFQTSSNGILAMGVKQEAEKAEQAIKAEGIKQEAQTAVQPEVISDSEDKKPVTVDLTDSSMSLLPALAFGLVSRSTNTRLFRLRSQIAGLL